MRLKNGRKGGNRVILAAFAAITILSLSSIAGADIVSLPLNAAGTYDVNTPAWTYNFDLGITFSEISHVYIDWSGEIYGMLFGIQGSTDTITGKGTLLAEFSSFPYRHTQVSGGDTTYPNPEPFDIIKEFTYPSSYWNDLLDGAGTISIYYPRPSSVFSNPFYIIDYGRSVINNATLIIDGTVIPEPSTVLILSLGMIGIWIKKFRNK